MTGYILDDRRSSSGRGKVFSLFNIIQTGSEVQAASYSMGTGVFSIGGKPAG
jgi:hypothetical protein